MRLFERLGDTIAQWIGESGVRLSIAIVLMFVLGCLCEIGLDKLYGV